MHGKEIYLKTDMSAVGGRKVCCKFAERADGANNEIVMIMVVMIRTGPDAMMKRSHKKRDNDDCDEEGRNLPDSQSPCDVGWRGRGQPAMFDYAGR